MKRLSRSYPSLMVFNLQRHEFKTTGYTPPCVRGSTVPTVSFKIVLLWLVAAQQTKPLFFFFFLYSNLNCCCCFSLWREDVSRSTLRSRRYYNWSHCLDKFSLQGRSSVCSAQAGFNETALAKQNRNTALPAGVSFWLTAPEFDSVMNILPPSCHAVIICVCLCHRRAREPVICWFAFADWRQNDQSSLLVCCSGESCYHSRRSVWHDSRGKGQSWRQDISGRLLDVQQELWIDSRLNQWWRSVWKMSLYKFQQKAVVTSVSFEDKCRFNIVNYWTHSR